MLFDEIEALCYELYRQLAMPQPQQNVCQHCKPNVHKQPQVLKGYWMPEVSRITYSGNKTIVWFADNSRVIVECSEGDKYDRQTALAYAMVKRMLGKVDPATKLVDGNGFGTKMKKLVDSGFDQDKEEQEATSKKRAAKAAHEAKQNAEHEARIERLAQQLAQKRAEEMLIAKRADEILEKMQTASGDKKQKIICETCQPKENDADKFDPKTYVKPDKPFSKFTQEEKRRYWKFHNAKRKGKI